LTQLESLPVLQWTLWALAIIVGALIVSFLVPPLVGILRDMRETLSRMRRTVAAWAREIVVPLWDNFWLRRERDPREPVLAGLNRVNLAARNLGAEQVASLRQLDESLENHVRLLSRAITPEAVSDVDRERMTRALVSGGVLKLLFLGLISVAVGLTNAALLNVFFREFLGTRSPVPTLFPGLQIGHVIAALLFLLELSTGVLIYWFGPDAHDDVGDLKVQHRSAPHRVYYAGAWGGFVFFALVELVAYAVLSDRLSIPQQLQIPVTSVMYPLMRYFFATFGLALTILLSALGHELAETFAQRKRASVERGFLRAMEKRDESIVRNVQRVRQAMQAITELAGGLPKAVATSFQNELQLLQPFPGAPVALYGGTVKVLASTEPTGASALAVPGLLLPEPPPIRDRTQIVGDLAINLTLLAVLGVVTWLTAGEIVRWLTNESSPVPMAMAQATGFFVPAGAIALGFAARNGLAKLRYASLVEQTLIEPRAKRVYGLLVAAGAVGVCVLLGTLTFEVGVLGQGLFLNVLLGLTQGAVLVGLGGFLDSALVSLSDAVLLLWIGVVRVFALLLEGLAHVVSALLLVVEFLLRLIAVPGDVLRVPRRLAGGGGGGGVGT
jgi:hypothetical protein